MPNSGAAGARRALPGDAPDPQGRAAAPGYSGRADTNEDVTLPGNILSVGSRRIHLPLAKREAGLAFHSNKSLKLLYFRFTQETVKRHFLPGLLIKRKSKSVMEEFRDSF